MSREQAVLLTLVAYKLALVGIGLWASRRTRDTTDFFLGGRRLGAWVASLSASASSSSAWTLLGVSGAAYLWGWPALWLFPATLMGFLINWLWVAPRLMALSRAEGSLTLTDVLAGPPGASLRDPIRRTASGIILFSFAFYIAAQFQAAGHAFAGTFGLDLTAAILIGGGIIIAYTLLGGFWAVSVTDSLQGLLMAASALLLPLTALVAVGGIGPLAEGLRALPPAAAGGGAGPAPGLLGLAFAAGTLGIGLGYPGQPHVVNRFMALRDAAALRHGRAIAMGWAAVIYGGMLLLGLCGRVLASRVENHEEIFFALAGDLLPPVIAGIMIAAVLSAVMSTADSQLLVAASTISHDLRTSGTAPVRGLAGSRLTVVGISGVAILTALFLPDAIFSRVLFAWHAVGSALGPLLLVRLAGRRVAPAATLAAMAAGFGLTILLHALPPAPGDALERLVPFAVALAIALVGRPRPA